MKCEPVLRNTYTLRETGRNHPPADRTESGAGAKNHPEARAQVCGNGSPPEKKQEWQKKYNAGQACQQAMRPFPPIDDLESVQVHAAVELPVLRDRLVFREFGLPRGLRERRQQTVIGFHSTMDSPDSVNRVAPPTISVKKIIAAAASSQSRTARRSMFDTLAVSGMSACLQEVARTI
jgi:hypothetical protein